MNNQSDYIKQFLIVLQDDCKELSPKEAAEWYEERIDDLLLKIMCNDANEKIKEEKQK